MTWGRTLVAATGIAALTGSGQFGVAYGLGLLRPGDPDRDQAWPTHVTWTVWFALLAVLAGAAGGAWAARRRGRPLGFGGRIAVCLAAAVGGTVVLPLAAWPAQAVTLARHDPVLEAGVSAALGVAAGLLAALAALSFREIAVGLATAAGISWALALVSVAFSLDLTTSAPPVRLGVLDLPGLPAEGRLVVGVACPLLVALAPGAALVAKARRRATADGADGDDPTATGDGAAGRLPPRTVAALPAAGALLALSYLIGGPGPGLADAAQAAPYVTSLAVLGAGALALLLVLLVRGPLFGRLSSLRLTPPRVRLPALPRPLPGPLRRSPGGRRRAGDAPGAPDGAAGDDATTVSTPAAGEAAPAAEPTTPPSDAEYVNWVKELAAGDDPEEPDTGRRRLRRGSSEALRDVDFALPPPPRADRDEA